MSVHDVEHYPEIKRLLGIPENEPIFILRAQDLLSLETVGFYRDNSVRPGNDPSFLDNLRQVENDFANWQIKNSDKTKWAD